MIRTLAATLLLVLLAGCGSMNVVSDGADSRLMLKGYDPVAYFTDGKPVPGHPDIKAEHQGVTYRFASEDHRRLFLANAAKFSRPGDTITLGARCEDDVIEVSVTDTGQGIPAEELPRIFGRFEQASTQATRGEVGTGLAVVPQDRDPLADPAMGLRDARPGRRCRPIVPCHRRQPQVERLRRAQQLDRDDLLDVRQDRPGVPGRGRAHRHVVLLVGGGGDRVGG